jgi:tripartite-type tricarboxylate transporter receptor subunit TctC
LNCGTAGVGSSIYLTMALFVNRTGVRIAHVPYKSGAPALTDLIAGQTQMQFVNVPPALQHIKAGRIKPVGVTSPRRTALLPDVPPVADAVPGFEDQQWQGLLGPANLPRSLVLKLNRALASVMSQAEVQTRMAGLGAEVVTGTPEQLNDFIKTEVARWSQIITPAMRID